MSIMMLNSSNTNINRRRCCNNKSSILLFVIVMIGLYRGTLAASRPLAAATTRRGFFQSGNLKASIDKLKHGKSTVVATAPKSPPKASTAATAVSSSSSSSSTSAISNILSFPKNYPFVFQLIVATIKTAGADLMTQMVAEGKSLNEVDWKRNGIFVVFGFAYLGGFQYYIMVNRYRKWFPTMDKFAKMSVTEKLKYHAGILDAGKMVLFDILVHLPLMYFPTYYAVKEFVSGETWNPIDWIQDGLTKYSKNYKDDLIAMVQLWLPSDCVQFILPMHIRMPFRHLISFFWTAYVSFTRGAIDTKSTPPVSVPVNN